MIAVTEVQKNIVEELDIAHFSVEEQEKIVDEIGGMLYKRMLLVIFDAVPAHEHEKLKQLMTAKLEEEVAALIHKSVPNIEELVEVEMKKSMGEYKEALAGVEVSK